MSFIYDLAELPVDDGLDLITNKIIDSVYWVGTSIKKICGYILICSLF